MSFRPFNVAFPGSFFGLVDNWSPLSDDIYITNISGDKNFFNGSAWAISQNGNAGLFPEEVVLFAWNPSKTSNGASGLGLITSSNGISFDVSLWDKSVTPKFPDGISSLASTYYANTAGANSSIGSSTPYYYEGGNLLIGDKGGLRNYQPKDKVFINQGPSADSQQYNNISVPFTGWSINPASPDYDPQGYIAGSLGGKGGGSDLYYVNGLTGAVKTFNSTGTGDTVLGTPLVIQDGDSQGFVTLRKTGSYNPSKGIYPKISLQLYSKSNGLINSETVFELKTTSETGFYTAETPFYLNANDRSGILLSTQQENRDTNTAYNPKLLYFDGIENLRNGKSTSLNIAPLIGDGFDKFIFSLNFVNFRNTIVGWSDKADGKYFEWVPFDQANPAQGSFKLVGDFSKDVSSYGSIQDIRPTADGTGLFIGYKYGSVQYYNGSYAYYISYNGSGVDQFNKNNFLTNLVPWGDKNVVTSLIVDKDSKTGGRITEVVNFTEVPDVSTERLSKKVLLGKAVYKKVIIGSNEAEKVIGKRDKVTGQKKDELFHGRFGGDVFNGKGGRDAYLFLEEDIVGLPLAKEDKTIEADIIKSFSRNDKIVIGRNLASRLNGNLSVARMRTKTAAQAYKGDKSFIYDEKNGGLYLNASKLIPSKDPALFAVLENTPQFGKANLEIL